jgi:type VII secretion integral membrane protein EccD
VADSALTGLCRIEVRADGASFDLAVPTDVPLGDLLPAIVDHAADGAGEDLRERGLAHQGWILQRLGGEPLDEDRTPAALGLHDGDRLYLRARADQLPPVHFDDLVDGIASTLRGRSDSWRPSATRFALLTGTAAVLAGCLPLLLSAVPAGGRVLAALGVAVLLLLGAAAASRAMGDLPAGALLGLAAVPYLVVAGALVPVPAGGSLLGGGGSLLAGHGGGTVLALVGSQVAAGAAAGAGGAVLALAAVGAASEVFLGVAAGCALLTAGGVAMLAGGPCCSAWRRRCWGCGGPDCASRRCRPTPTSCRRASSRTRAPTWWPAPPSPTATPRRSCWPAAAC